MSLTVELTYEMAKLLGTPRFEVEGARTVQDVLAAVRARFQDQGEAFDRMARSAAVALNGVLVSHRHGRATKVQDGDRLGFVKVASGG